MNTHTIQTDAPPSQPSKRILERYPPLIIGTEHHFCPGCGEPIAMRVITEALTELKLTNRAIGVWGIGCYTLFTQAVDLEIVQALHGRAPSLATGVKRMQPDVTVFTVQGDGDMVNEGLQEVIHTAARGENVTCVLMNNGVFGETGGHMTATSVIGQKTKNTLEGRSAETHGYPIRIGDLLAKLEGVAYVARGSVSTAQAVFATKKMLKRAFDIQTQKLGFSFVEILTMCPTGWFMPASEGPDYMESTLGQIHGFGEIKAPPT